MGHPARDVEHRQLPEPAHPQLAYLRAKSLPRVSLIRWAQTPWNIDPCGQCGWRPSRHRIARIAAWTLEQGVEVAGAQRLAPAHALEHVLLQCEECGTVNEFERVDSRPLRSAVAWAVAFAPFVAYLVDLVLAPTVDEVHDWLLVVSLPWMLIALVLLAGWAQRYELQSPLTTTAAARARTARLARRATIALGIVSLCFAVFVVVDPWL